MPLRRLLYAGRAYEWLGEGDARYRTTLVKIPTPEFYIFYNGKRDYPAKVNLSLSGALLDSTGVQPVYRYGEEVQKKRRTAVKSGSGMSRKENEPLAKIDREDMLELTRRMTLQRNCFSRIAGAYLDREGYVDGTFNRHFQNLSAKEQRQNLEIAKTVPFSKTNIQLQEYFFEEIRRRPGSAWQLLMALRDCELKNDALLYTFYERFGENYQAAGEYAVYFFYGNYDVPVKAADKEDLRESEEVYRFMICTVCPVSGDYEAGHPECGFLFPAFRDRSGDINRIHIFQKDPSSPHAELAEKILLG